MDTDSQRIFLVFGIIIGLVIMYYLIRWIFDVPKQTRYLEAQIKLLTEIAKKQAVDDSKIRKIVRDAFDSEDSI